MQKKKTRKNEAINKITNAFSEKLDNRFKIDYEQLLKRKYKKERTTMVSKIFYEFESKNIKLTDPRISEMVEILSDYERNNKDIDYEMFKSIVKPKYKLFKSVIHNRMVIKDCDDFVKRTQAIFDEVEQADYGGFLPTYIPGLNKVDPDKF
jgi:hypothetical protein